MVAGYIMRQPRQFTSGFDDGGLGAVWGRWRLDDRLLALALISRKFTDLPICLFLDKIRMISPFGKQSLPDELWLFWHL